MRRVIALSSSSTKRGEMQIRTYRLSFEVIGTYTLVFSSGRSGVHYHSTGNMYAFWTLL